jgi:hypothetical protein
LLRRCTHDGTIVFALDFQEPMWSEWRTVGTIPSDAQPNAAASSARYLNSQAVSVGSFSGVLPENLKCRPSRRVRQIRGLLSELGGCSPGAAGELGDVLTE